jgi:hypothetical protein
MREFDALDGQRQPIFGQIEMGWWTDRPATGGYAGSLAPTEMRAAAWQSIIGGARGVIYFPFNFLGVDGNTATHHIQRDTSGDYTAIQTMTDKTNAAITALAPVINAEFAHGYLTLSSGVNAMVKYYGGKFYIFAGNKDNSSKTGTFTLTGAAGTTATVIGENRTVSISGGSFSDTFADGNAIHIYRID